MKHINILQKILTLVAVVASGFTASAQLSGTYTIGGTSPDYSTLSAAINDLNSSGVNGPVTFMIRDGNYSGTAWRGSIGAITGASATNRITFTSQSNDATKVTIQASTTSSANYVFRFSNASFITVKDLTLTTNTVSYQRLFEFQSTASNDSVYNCVLQGRTTNSSSNARALIYANSFTGNNNVFMNNEFDEGGTWVYWRGSNTTTGPSNTVFAGNTFSNTSGYYGVYSYYTSGLKFHNNSFDRYGSGTFYNMYCYYPNDDYEIIGNTVDVRGTGTVYGIHGYYMNYYSGNTTNVPRIHNNTVTVTNTSGSSYPMYLYRGVRATVLNNSIECSNTSGYIYNYGPMYYGEHSRASNNTIDLEMTTTGSGYIYNYMVYNGASQPDTFSNNTIAVNKPGSGSLYNYISYYGNTRIENNTYNFYGGKSTTYNYFYYSNGAIFKNNVLNSTNTTGTHYGAYMYNTTSYSGGIYDGNEFNISNTSGTVYGIYAYYWSGDVFMNNKVVTKTSGTNYTLRSYYNYNGKYYNNTFHSNATGSTNYVGYLYNTSSSYQSEFKNNIFSKSGTSGYGVYVYSQNYTEMDYNLYYVNGGTLLRQVSPSVTTNSITTWRAQTGNDMNSLTYEPKYMDAANGNLTPDITSPNAWAINGRGVHIDNDTMDVVGNPRPRTTADGVPDIGCYSITPTSTPPLCDATPAMPTANTDQVFTFGEDTVAVISWANTVPSNSVDIRQYTGTKANPINAGVERMFFYTALDGNDYLHAATPKVYYKDPWIGNISSETNAVIAKSSAGNSWVGYNYNNATTDTVRNILAPVNDFDSLGNYTGVENARIGVRCVPTPGGFDFDNITKESADATWDAIWNPVGYQVVIKTTPGTPGAGAGTTVTSNNISFSGLDEDTKYYVYVRFICGANDTSAWGVDTFWTLISCHEPALTLSQLNTDKVVVSWDPIKTATDYEYVIDKSPNDPSFGTAIKATSFLAPYLNSGETYYVHVRSNCSSIYPQSPWATQSFQTWALGVGNVANSASGMTAYPNPASDVLKVEVGGQIGSGAVLQLTDVTGKVVILESVEDNTTELNVSELPSGIYLMKYRDDNRTETIKVTKQ